MSELSGETEQVLPDRVYNPAIDKIVIAGSPLYICAETNRWRLQDSQKLSQLHFLAGEDQLISLIGTYHTRRENGLTDRLCEILFARQRARTSLILEGLFGYDGEVPPLPADAIKTTAGEFAFLAAYGDKFGMEIIPGEPEPYDNAQYILANYPHISREDIGLHYSIKAIAQHLRTGFYTPLAAVAPRLYIAAGTTGEREQGGWVQTIMRHRELAHLTPELHMHIAQQMPDIIRNINAAFTKLTLQPGLVHLTPNGHVRLNYELTTPPIAWDPVPELMHVQSTPLTDISCLDMLCRDRHFFSLLDTAVQSGRDAIFVGGASHLSTLTPAFNAAYATLDFHQTIKGWPY